MQVTCPVCNRSSDVPEAYRGKNWRCPSCQIRLRPELDGSVVLLDPAPARADGGTDNARPRKGTTKMARTLLFLAGAAAGAALAYLWLR